MKKKQTGSDVAVVELSRYEIDLLIYLYNTSDRRLSKRDETFIKELKEMSELMDDLGGMEADIKKSFGL